MTEERRYGKWAGQPDGVPEQGNLCITEVWPPGRMTASQCRRLRGHGPNKLYCKQHAKKLLVKVIEEE